MPLEDETGFVNLVIWKNVLKQYERIVKTISFPGVTGKIQTDSNVTHLIVKKL